jgi:hypothetical protein
MRNVPLILSKSSTQHVAPWRSRQGSSGGHGSKKIKAGTAFVMSDRRGRVNFAAREGLAATGRSTGVVEVGAVLRVRES